MPTKNYSDTRKRTSAEYVRFSPAHRVTLRILNPNARTVWKHWLDEANSGRGLMINCPNIQPSMDACPIDRELKGLPRESEERRARSAKRRYMVNVLDRTPYTLCPACDSSTPGKDCVSCGASVKNNKFAPLNRVKILEGGPRLFTETLNGVDKLQTEEFELAITDYDITFQTQGTGRERKISAIPGVASVIGEDELLDIETGEPQKLFDLDLLAEPTAIEDIELFMKGASVDDVNSVRGIV
jgi:hypothetical protein